MSDWMSMERKLFLKRLGMGIMAVPLAGHCISEPELPEFECVPTPSETGGPFPTKDPASLTIQDIRSDRQGLDLWINISVRNTSCDPLLDVVIDIWHCDKDGNYSEYGGTGLQSANYTSAHFLRGRQSPHQNGTANFLSIFPGWYPGRAPHIHVHIYRASTGRSLLVTQIAFPKDITDTVYTSSQLYSSRGKQDRTNETDSVFRDGFTEELATVRAHPDIPGYVLDHTITLDA
jgi:protocatechuate 3,4-dioxygenase beta subunit